MITIKKLKTLKAGTLRRKTAVIMQAFEDDLRKGHDVNQRYLADFLELTADAFRADEAVASRALALRGSAGAFTSSELLREINGLRHRVLSVLGAEPADWDLAATADPVIRAGGDEPGNGETAEGIELFIDDIRSPFNLGSIFRTSEAFGVSKILLSPDCPPPDHPRCLRSSMGSTEMVQWERCPAETAFGGKIVFALELGGAPIDQFEFPRNGIAVIGSEELGVSPAARKAAENSGGLVSIPVYGKKGSLNVSVAFGIMMQRWRESLSGYKK